jgi:hypothetical protein
MTTYLEARAQALELKQSRLAPIAKYRDGQEVSSSHGQGTILEAIFNMVPWMYSYKVALDDQYGTQSGSVIEVMEWGLSEVKL